MAPLQLAAIAVVADPIAGDQAVAAVFEQHSLFAISLGHISGEGVVARLYDENPNVSAAAGHASADDIIIRLDEHSRICRPAAGAGCPQALHSCTISRYGYGRTALRLDMWEAAPGSDAPEGQGPVHSQTLLIVSAGNLHRLACRGGVYGCLNALPQLHRDGGTRAAADKAGGYQE